MGNEAESRGLMQLINGTKENFDTVMEKMAEDEQGIYLYKNLKAIVIGVSKYMQGNGKSDLPNAARDAASVRDFLKENYEMKDEDIHFMGETVLAEEAAKMIKEVCESLKSKDNLLLYFAGHGEEIDGHSYLLFTDSKKYLDYEGKLAVNNAVPLQFINDTLKKCMARMKVRIFDACHSAEEFNGGFSRGFEEDDALMRELNKYMSYTMEEIEALEIPAEDTLAARGFMDKDPEGFMTSRFLEDLIINEKGWVTFCGCGIRECSYDLPVIYHGIFTYCLLEGLKGKARRSNGVMHMEDVKIFTCNIVSRIMEHRQHPQYHCAVEGNIIVG